MFGALDEQLKFFEDEPKNIQLNFVDIVNANCVHKNVKVSRGMIDAFIEIARDYSRIILEDSENTENIYTKTMLKHKANKFLEMADYIATEIGYNKSCKITKDIDDVGMDAFSIMGRRNRPKKNENEEDKSTVEKVVDKKNNSKKKKGEKK